MCVCVQYFSLSLSLSCFILSTYFMGRIIKLNLHNTPNQEPMQWNNFSNSITTLTWHLHCISSTMKIFLSKWTWTLFLIYKFIAINSNEKIDHFFYGIMFVWNWILVRYIFWAFPLQKKEEKQIFNQKMSSFLSIRIKLINFHTCICSKTVFLQLWSHLLEIGFNLENVQWINQYAKCKWFFPWFCAN